MNNLDTDNLDEQLRTALMRKEPSPDFTEQVLARVRANSKKSERSPFNPLAYLRLPLGWTSLATAAAAAALLVGSVVLLYHHSRTIRQAKPTAGLASNEAGPDREQVLQHSASLPALEQPSSDHRVASVGSGTARVSSARPRHTSFASLAPRRESVSSEGQRAKEQLELALYIASSKLNQAERAVSHLNQDDDQPPGPAPDQRHIDR